MANAKQQAYLNKFIVAIETFRIATEEFASACTVALRETDPARLTEAQSNMDREYAYCSQLSGKLTGMFDEFHKEILQRQIFQGGSLKETEWTLFKVQCAHLFSQYNSIRETMNAAITSYHATNKRNVKRNLQNSLEAQGQYLDEEQIDQVVEVAVKTREESQAFQIAQRILRVMTLRHEAFLDIEASMACLAQSTIDLHALIFQQGAHIELIYRNVEEANKAVVVGISQIKQAKEHRQKQHCCVIC